MKMEAETGALHLPVKEHQGPQEREKEVASRDLQVTHYQHLNFGSVASGTRRE
jgi:hypothetical protein